MKDRPGFGDSTLIDPDIGFLERKRLREASRELSYLLVLGYGIGAGLIGLGAYKYFLDIEAYDPLWAGIIWFGFLSLWVTLIAPYFWRLPEQYLRRFGNRVGHVLISIILIPIYYIMIWPAGMVLRRVRGTHPIYAWLNQPRDDMQGWQDKALPYDLDDPRAYTTNPRRKVSMLRVILFFIHGGHFLFIPVLIIIVSLGIALFFLQTSALAPFIYTLF